MSIDDLKILLIRLNNPQITYEEFLQKYKEMEVLDE
jgi:hypothetical protein